MFDFFKSRKRHSGEMSDKRKLISRIIVAVVLIGGIIVGFLTSGNTETEVNIADVFRFRFSIVDAIVIGLLFIVYIVIRINRRRNGGK
ncbi:MAG: hypothetical protein IK093_14085 [Ruminiclostridium sp.]|nr:hypothetical protein [Ruminiclostridium sp.]